MPPGRTCSSRETLSRTKETRSNHSKNPLTLPFLDDPFDVRRPPHGEDVVFVEDG